MPEEVVRNTFFRGIPRLSILYISTTWERPSRRDGPRRRSLATVLGKAYAVGDIARRISLRSNGPLLVHNNYELCTGLSDPWIRTNHSVLNENNWRNPYDNWSISCGWRGCHPSRSVVRWGTLRSNNQPRCRICRRTRRTHSWGMLGWPSMRSHNPARPCCRQSGCMEPSTCCTWTTRRRGCCCRKRKFRLWKNNECVI